MNYERLYNNIIQKALARVGTEGYTETHHILPRSMGGADVASNLVVLTSQEHYVAHYCLAKFTTGKNKVSMVFAFNCMNQFNSTGKRYKNSRLYTSLRIEAAELSKTLNKGRLVSLITRKKQSKSLSGAKNPMYGKTHSNTYKQKLSETMAGKGNPFYGKTHSETTKLKLSKKAQNRNRDEVLIRAISRMEKVTEFKGYYFAFNKYYVNIKINGKSKSFGSYETEAEASKVALRERTKYLETLKAELEKLTLKDAA